MVDHLVPFCEVDRLDLDDDFVGTHSERICCLETLCQLIPLVVGCQRFVPCQVVPTLEDEPRVVLNELVLARATVEKAA